MFAKRLVILGAGGHGTSVANVAISAGYKIIAFVDPKADLTSKFDIQNISEIDLLPNYRNLHYAIAIGDNSLREKIYLEVTERFGLLKFPMLAHKSAVISNFTKVGMGTIVMPHSIIGPNCEVGIFCIINTKASIDHDSKMSNFASLAPGAITAGHVDIGTRTAVSLGAIIKQKISIGSDAVIGSNSYVYSDIPSNCIAYGTPAKKIRDRGIGDPYLD
jgi:sugar O-acyltransferase (sialic acid O-acetyltransferase NeuD family)